MPDENLFAKQSYDKQLESEPAEPVIGKVVGRHYLILEVLGKGGMATTYKAKHLLLNKIVALKIIDQSVDGKSIMRFQQEAQTVDSLNHPNIAALREFAYDDSGFPFLVMDFVIGRTLAEIIEEDGRYEQEALLDVARQIAEGLNHAHMHNVIHRDIKPSNIMIAVDRDGNRQVKLLDFGIARFASGEDIQRLTSTGDLIGTPLYMSPEQSQGKKVDARSDIYSMGCVLYELATGRPPFTGDSALEILQAHANQIPPAPLAAAPKIDKKLNNLILKALAKDPAQRFQNAAEIMRVLVPMTGKSWTKTLQRPTIFAPLALVVLVIAGLSAFLGLRVPEQHADDVVHVPTPSASIPAAANAAVPAAADDKLAPPSQQALAQQAVELKRKLDVLNTGQKSSILDEEKALQWLRLGINELYQKKTLPAFSDLEEARRLTRADSVIYQIMSWQGVAYGQLKNHEKAVAMLKDAVSKTKEKFYKGKENSEVIGPNAIVIAGESELLGNELFALGRVREAQAVYLQAQILYRQNHGLADAARVEERLQVVRGALNRHQEEKTPGLRKTTNSESHDRPAQER